MERIKIVRRDSRDLGLTTFGVTTICHTNPDYFRWCTEQETSLVNIGIF